MAMLANLIPAQNQKDLWVPRPASVRLTPLLDWGGGPVTAMITVGNIAYGMYASSQFAGKDRPFAYNMATGSFLSISGLSASNLPTSQSTTGDWTPPTVAQVGSRIVFTHPGFPGGPTNSPFYNVLQANTHSNTTLDGITPVVFPFLQVGMQVIGPGINAGTTIAAISQPIVYATATGTSGNNFFTVTSATGIAIGQTAAGPGIPIGSLITAVAGTTITIGANLTANLSSTLITFTGSIVTLSQTATATANAVGMTVVAAMAIKFGWLDLSGFSLSTQGNTALGVPYITGNPTIAGLQPGMNISGPNIPANTTITGFNSVVVSGTCTFSSGSNSVSLNAVAGNGQPAVGMTVAGAGIPSGTVVVAVSGTGNVNCTLNNNTTAGGPATLTFSGAIIGLSQAATGPATATGQTFSISAGSQSAPLWGAGDTNINGLAAVPIFVAQFSGRAYYGVNTTSPNIGGVTASDSGIACQVTNATQIITFNDGLFVTAGMGLALFNQLGGIIQSLMVFQDDSNIRQITGDFALGNWSQNSLLTATGTGSPNAIASTPRGILFIASDGMRLIDFDARVSDPIGADGDGLILPFTNAVTPTRMQGDYNENIYRLTVTWQPPASVALVWGTAVRTDEFWFHLPKSISAPIEQGRWSGPHPSTMDQLAPWGARSSFLIAPMGDRGFLDRGDVIPTTSSVYFEFGAPMSWTMTTPLLPDDEEMMMNAVGRSSIFSLVPSTTQLLASATDDHGNLLAQGYVWEGPTSTLRHLRVGWDQGFEFRQAQFSITGQSAATIQLGTMAHTFQRLGKSQADFPIEFVLGQSILGGPDVLGP